MGTGVRYWGGGRGGSVGRECGWRGVAADLDVCVAPRRSRVCLLWVTKRQMPVRVHRVRYLNNFARRWSTGRGVVDGTWWALRRYHFPRLALDERVHGTTPAPARRTHRARTAAGTPPQECEFNV